MKNTILIVEDSEIMRREVAHVLESAGYRVVQACDGLDGLARLADDPSIGLVLCDVMMPRMTGLDMLEQLKADHRAAALPVLMLTAEGHADLIARAKRAGARGWIVKPFNPLHLLAAARKIVGDPKPPAPVVQASTTADLRH